MPRGMSLRTHLDEVRHAARAVQAGLGHGFLEATYVDALALELAWRGVPHRRDVELSVAYCGHPVRGGARADLVVADVAVQVRARPLLERPDVAQLAHVVRAAGLPRGLLVNFGTWGLEERLVLPRRGPGPPAPRASLDHGPPAQATASRAAVAAVTPGRTRAPP